MVSQNSSSKADCKVKPDPFLVNQTPRPTEGRNEAPSSWLDTRKGSGDNKILLNLVPAEYFVQRENIRLEIQANS